MLDMNTLITVNGTGNPSVYQSKNEKMVDSENKENEICLSDNSMAEPEEGQILEDEEELEDISSDEDPIVFTEADEASMRKRIEELELRNAELEKIAVISVINNYDLGTSKIVSQSEKQIVDIIELSDYDEYPKYAANETAPTSYVPFEDKFNGLKSYYNPYSKVTSGFQNSTSKSYHKSRKRRRRTRSTDVRVYDENQSSKINARIRKKRKKSPSPILDSTNSRQKSAGIRRHRSRSKRSRKKRRLKNTHYDSSSNGSEEDKADGFEINREELRKAIKRNSEIGLKGNIRNIVGYKKYKNAINVDDSVIEIENDNEVEKINSKVLEENENAPAVQSDESDSLEEQTLRLIALKSAIVKKHLDRKKRKEIEERKPYSPSDFDYWCNEFNTSNSPKELDELEIIESNNISPSDSPLVLSDEEADTKPIDIDIGNSDSDSNIPTFIDSPNDWQHTLPDITVLRQYAPPPPSINIISQMPIRFENKYEQKHVEKQDSKLLISQKNSSPDDMSDEEELALRALLLSKMNSPKVNNMITTKTVLTENSQNTSASINNEIIAKNIKMLVENSKSPINNEIKGTNCAEVISNLEEQLLSNFGNENRTESLLKEAVKRLKTTTLSDLVDFEPSILMSSNVDENETEISLNYGVPDAKISCNIDKNFTINESLPEFVLREHIDSNYLSNNDENSSSELLMESRKKLSKFIQCFNKENSNSDAVDMIMMDSNTSSDNEDGIDDNKCSVKIEPVSCIETLQKIIELNYDKLVKVDIDQEEINDTEIVLNHIENSEDPKENQQNENSTIPLRLSLDQKESNTQLESDISNIQKNRNVNDSENQIPLDNEIPNAKENKNSNIKSNSELIIQDKFDCTLEITKKIESLQKLSDSIAQTTKITAKAKASLDVSKTQSVNSHSSQATNNTVQSRKIIKINKIINQTSSTTIKRNHVNVITNNAVPQTTNNISISPAPLLETNLGRSKINRTVGKIIINIGGSSSEDDDIFFDDISSDKTGQGENLDKENATRMDFLDSPCYSPKNVYGTDIIGDLESDKNLTNNDSNSSLSPEESAEKLLGTDKTTSFSRNVINDVFQAKLDKFLKNARTQVEIVKKEEKSKTVDETQSPPNKRHTQSLSSSGVTPVAVRHLPQSSQLEYRMLVSRMKLLERQKFIKDKELEQKSMESIEKSEATDNTENVKVNASLMLCDIPNVATTKDKDENIHILKDETSTTDLNKKEFAKETNHEEDKRKVEEPKDELINHSEAKRGNVLNQSSELQKYEMAYERNNKSLLENLDRALEFVSMGKEVKIKKVLLESKLEKLKSELRVCEASLKLENQKIAKIYPAISKSYETIVNLKTRRVKLSKVSKHLGKSLNGDSYKVKEGNNIEIQKKFKSLLSGINYLKNVNIRDIEKNLKDQDIQTVGPLNETPNINNKINVNSPSKEKSEKAKELNDKPVKAVEKEQISIEASSVENNKELVETVSALSKKMIDELQTSMSNDNSDNLDQAEHKVDESLPKILIEEENKTNVGNCKYISPLEFLTERDQSNGNSVINPNEVICPFQLMGQCDDKDCKFNHLNLDCSS